MVSFAIVNDIPSVAPFEIVSLETILQKYGNEIQYQEFMPSQDVCYDPIPFVPEEFRSFQPHHVTFDKTWVLTIPHGRVCATWGYVLIHEKYMLRELFWPCVPFVYALNLLNHDRYAFANVRHISGRVVVISGAGATNYVHFLMEIMGRLAMLEIMGIDYDWIYMPYEKYLPYQPFRQQILTAWGIDQSKIIEPFDEFTCIEADELIVPSRSFYQIPTPKHTMHSHYTPLCGVYSPTWLTEYYRDKFLPLVNKSTVNHDRQRIFISRKDSGSGLRPMLNEDDVFALFETRGFKKYFLAELTFLQQVELFSNAEIVVGANGAGLYNMLFCLPGTKIVEIFQQRVDSTYAFLAQTVGLDYTPVKTVEFPLHDREGGNPSIVPLSIIENVITSLNL